MNINIFKKNFKVFNEKVVLCHLIARVRIYDGVNSCKYNHPENVYIFEANGRAKCSPEEEEFDLEVGKNIAYKRAYKRLLNKILKTVCENEKRCINVYRHLECDQESIMRKILLLDND